MNTTMRKIVVIVALVLFAMLANLWGEAGWGHVGESGIDPALLATGTAVGLLLLCAWLSGLISRRVGLPMVTGFLLIGIVLGPSALGVVTADQQRYLLLIDKLAIALIALTAGGEIRLSFLKGSLKAISSIIGVQVGCVLVVSTVVFAMILPRMGSLAGIGTGDAWRIGLLLAVLACSSSPAIAIAVVTELRAKGPLTQLLLSATVCKDLVVIILFAVALSFSVGGLAAGQGGGGEHLSLMTIIGQEHLPLMTIIGQHIVGSMVAGVIVGILITGYLRRVRAHLTIFLVLVCFGIALVSKPLHLDPLITALIAGLLMRNAWHEISEDFFEEIEDLSLPVYCVFFAVAGTRVDLVALGELWHWALIGVVVRLSMLAGGTMLGAKLGGVDRDIGRVLWGGFVSRAGVSIALAGLIYDALEGTDYATPVFNLALGMVAFDELLGPLMLKRMLTDSGETGARGAAAHPG